MVGTVIQQAEGGGLGSTAVSTSISTALSSANSLVTSLSTAVGSGGGSPAGNIFGLILSPDATSTVLDISAGNCTDSTAVATITLPAFTKAFGTAWAAGTGNGALDTGSIANSTWYHVYAISKAGGANPDILVSTSATVGGLTFPTGYTLARRIGSFLTNGSAQVTPFSQFADEFRWKVQVTSLNTATTSTSAALLAVATPLGVQTRAMLMVGTNQTGGVTTVVTSPDDTDQAPSASGTGPWTVPPDGSGWVATIGLFRTNTSSQVRHRESQSSGFTNLSIYTIGWIDDRGRNQ